MIIFCNNYIFYYNVRRQEYKSLHLIVSICKTNIRSRNYFPLSIFSATERALSLPTQQIIRLQLSSRIYRCTPFNVRVNDRTKPFFAGLPETNPGDILLSVTIPPDSHSLILPEPLPPGLRRLVSFFNYSTPTTSLLERFYNRHDFPKRQRYPSRVRYTARCERIRLESRTFVWNLQWKLHRIWPCLKILLW